MYAHASGAGFVTRYRFILLFAALSLYFVLIPLVHHLREVLHPATPPLLEEVTFIAVLTAVVLSVRKKRRWKVFTLMLGLPAIGLGLLHLYVPSKRLEIIHYLFALAFLGDSIWVMLLSIYARQRVTLDTVFASLCVYILLGVVWSLAYSLINILDPTAFRSTIHGDPANPVLQFEDGRKTTVLYFSFTTLTTLGYGDIVPATPITRMLSCLEALTGQLFLAVLVARLVGIQITESMARTPAIGPESSEYQWSGQTRAEPLRPFAQEYLDE